ncbi:MAG: tetratricopeptide repeat protein [Luteolibacter sp.]|uniref:tetratricopeptide repeat protein n=1 Tax=Luteolibacter sp. TaxID=1962973 RepID=UPI003265B2AF
MKPFNTFLSVLLGLSIISADAEGRGDGKRSGGGGGGGGRSSAPSRSSSSASRSPMTGSKVQRPSPQPAAKPATRPSQPASKPAARPAPQPAQRPAPKPERPTTRPAPAPDRNPGGGGGAGNRPGNGGGGDNRPGNGGGDNRPGGGGAGTRPDNKLPDNRPGNGGGDNRPGGGGAGARPDNKLPDNRPGNGGGDNRPGGNGNGGNGIRPGGNGNDNRPGNGGDNRPGGNNNGNGIRPGGNGGGTDNRPNINRPNNNRPSTMPGMVTYPNRPGNNNNRGNGNGNGNNINSGNTYVKNVNNNRKNTYLNRPSQLPARDRDWDNNRWGGNRGVWGNNNNVNIKVDNHFRNSNNYSYRPNYWGARPWWGAGSCHSWHHGHWNYGYNNRYYHNHYYYNDGNFASGFMWGIAAWSLGNMIYDMGYQSYRNPYPAPPVQSSVSKTTINYNQPVSVTAAANPPGDEAATTLAETKSADATEASRAAFKTGDYVAALKSADEAIAYTPGDVTLHEYRALVLFALGRYSDAAGVLNPVLASGPGWGWDTMVGFYGSATTYSDQLRKLENYVKGKPDAADARFLLGYHYLVSGHMEDAYEQFAKASTLQPADSVSRQLRDLTKSSLPDNGDDATPEAPEPPAPAPIPSEKLVGTWVSDRGEAGKVTFTMAESGDYTWSYINGGDSKLMKGTYGLDDKGLLVLSSDDSQMVSAVTLDGDSKMKFVLVGAPDGDPGLDFTKG